MPLGLTPAVLSLSLDHRLRAVPAQQAAPCAVWHPMQDVEDASTSTSTSTSMSTSTTSTSTSRIVVSMPEPLLPAPQRSACCHRSQLAAGHARSFGLRLVRLLSAQLAVVLHCLADWLDGGRVLCKLTKTDFFRWTRGQGQLGSCGTLAGQVGKAAVECFRWWSCTRSRLLVAYTAVLRDALKCTPRS